MCPCSWHILFPWLTRLTKGLLLLHDWCSLWAVVAWELFDMDTLCSLYCMLPTWNCACVYPGFKRLLSPSCLRAVPFSLAMTIYNKTVIFEVMLVIISRQHLGRCVWCGSTGQLQPTGQLLACWAAQLGPGHGSTASAAQRRGAGWQVRAGVSGESLEPANSELCQCLDLKMVVSSVRGYKR